MRLLSVIAVAVRRPAIVTPPRRLAVVDETAHFEFLFVYCIEISRLLVGGDSGARPGLNTPNEHAARTVSATVATRVDRLTCQPIRRD